MDDQPTTEPPAAGWRIKERPEDFFVQEIPAYEPSGEGEHVMFEVQKVDLTTPAMIGRLADAFDIDRRDIGYAGLKDKDAVTQQILTAWGVTEEQVMTTPVEGVTVRWAARHLNKLRLGHLKGNRFAIKVRGVDPTKVIKLPPILRKFEAEGMANFFGEQRFGRHDDNDAKGLALLRGEIRPRSLPKRDVQFFLSALQSRLFNDVVRARQPNLGTLMTGDYAYKHLNGAAFLVTDAAVEQPRADAFEISPTGPLFGTRMSQPTGDPLDIEQNVLTAHGLSDENFRNPSGISLQGARRPLRVRPTDCRVEGGVDEHGGYITLVFNLPAGSYATVLVDQVMEAM